MPGIAGARRNQHGGGAAKGASFGWLNRELIASGKLAPHMNVFGGEDRFWLGPEGGQFSLFFAPGAAQDLGALANPRADRRRAVHAGGKGGRPGAAAQDHALTNASGTAFDLDVEREVRLYAAERTWEQAGVTANRRVAVVGFESRNRVTNGRRALAPRHRAGVDLDRRHVFAVAGDASLYAVPARARKRSWARS